MPTIGVDYGHNVNGDTGARGVKFEDAVVREVGDLVVADLRSRDWEVVLLHPSRASSVSDSLEQRVRAANRQKLDLVLSLHCNAFNRKARGSEMFVSGRSVLANRVAQEILGNICDLGYISRGVKNGRFRMILGPIAPSILVEQFFIDSAEDCALYEPKSMAQAISEGVRAIDSVDSVKSFKSKEFVIADLSETASERIKLLVDQPTCLYKEVGGAEQETLLPGEYHVDWLVEEEGHYLLKIDGDQRFIASGEARIINV